MENIGILIIDDDVASQAALRQVLGVEGWFVEATGSPSQAFQELATGKWSLVLANVETTGVIGALFTTLRELAQAQAPADSADSAGKAQVRVLFLVPESAAAKAKPLLEQAHLPYVPKPLSFNDLLERVSDLLVEAKVIAAPIRQVRERFGSARKSRDTGRDAGRNTGMFARNEDYQWSEEELLEYERQEVETRRKKKKKETTLG